MIPSTDSYSFQPVQDLPETYSDLVFPPNKNKCDNVVDNTSVTTDINCNNIEKKSNLAAYTDATINSKLFHCAIEGGDITLRAHPE